MRRNLIVGKASSQCTIEIQEELLKGILITGKFIKFIKFMRLIKK
jgi:hypothetical protein